MAPLEFKIVLLPASPTQSTHVENHVPLQSKVLTWLEEDTKTVANLCQDLQAYCNTEYFGDRPITIRNVQQQDGSDLAKHLVLGSILTNASAGDRLWVFYIAATPKSKKHRRRKYGRWSSNKPALDDAEASPSQNPTQLKTAHKRQPSQNIHSSDPKRLKLDSSKVSSSGKANDPKASKNQTSHQTKSPNDKIVEDREEVAFTGMQMMPQVVIPTRQSRDNASASQPEQTSKTPNSLQSTKARVDSASAVPHSSPGAGPSQMRSSSIKPASTGKLKPVSKSLAPMKQSRLEVERYTGKGKRPAAAPLPASAASASSVTISEDKKPTATIAKSKHHNTKAGPTSIEESKTARGNAAESKEKDYGSSSQAPILVTDEGGPQEPIIVSADEATVPSRKTLNLTPPKSAAHTAKSPRAADPKKSPIVNGEDKAPPNGAAQSKSHVSGVLDKSGIANTENRAAAPSENKSVPSSTGSSNDESSSGSSGSDISSHESDDTEMKAKIQEIREESNRARGKAPSATRKPGKSSEGQSGKR
ncbi:MAG: hypothetical protein M1831_000771 [Alyxoria varia]|nr:MAG: hypothetical protein M1831_000771 [Alyxoria varia]